MEPSPAGKPIAPAVLQSDSFALSEPPREGPLNSSPRPPAGAPYVPQAADKPPLPIWLRRVWLVIYVGFCIELGLWLVVAPWRTVWTNNGLLFDYPVLRHILLNYFVRGVVTGLGLIDLGLGISAAVTYREK